MDAVILSPAPNPRRFFFLASAFIIVASLYLGREVLIPVSLAILLSFLLVPFVAHVEKVGLKRVPSVIVVTLLSFTILASLGWVFTQQLADLARDLPLYSDNLRERVKNLKPSDSGAISGLKNAVTEINKEIVSASSNAETASQSSATPARSHLSKELGQRPGENETVPLWIKPVEAPLASFQFLENALMPILNPLATAGIVVIFVIFMLIHREDLRNRIIRLVGEGQLTVTTEALDNAAGKVSSYLSMQLLLNILYGIPVALGLYFIGIPNPILWGLFSAALRFIPYLGGWIAASMPIALSLAISPDWLQPLSTLGLFVTLELVSGNIVEPLLFSQSTGLSALAVLVSAVFWTAIWGGVGLFLSTPLTVCLVVMGQYVPALQFITILLGDKPALPPHVRMYQRLLALDHEEATDLMYEVLKTKPIEYFYEEMLLPALHLAGQDRHRGAVDEFKEQAVRISMKEIIEEAEEYNDLERAKLASPADTKEAGDNLNLSHVTLFPARDDADEICAIALSHLLRHRGHETEVISLKERADKIAAIAQKGAGVFVISALPPSALSHTKSLLKKMQAKDPSAKVIIGLWNAGEVLEKAQERLTVTAGGHQQIVTSFTRALERIAEFSQAANLNVT